MDSKPMQCTCLQCGHGFRDREAAHDVRGDRLCPHCHSPRIERRPTRGQLLANFIIEYNRY